MYRWIDHTAELELRIEAPSEEGVFEEALAAVSDLLGEAPGGSPQRHDVTADGSDRATLLAAWLDELVFIAESEALIARRVLTLDLGGASLRATIEAERGDARHLVKGVTYHGLRFERAAKGFAAAVVLDV